MRDIENKKDIEILVNAFYAEVRKDATIGPVFAARIEDARWPAHLEKMYGFWNTVLFSVPDYSGSPFDKHERLPLEDRHFDQWLGMWSQTVDSLFSGPNAETIKSKARHIGLTFQAKINLGKG